MDDRVLMKVFVAVNELAHDDKGFIFGELFSFIEDVFE